MVLMQVLYRTFDHDAITGGNSKENHIWCVNIGKYMVFRPIVAFD